MKNKIKKYLFTQAVDVLSTNDQFQFGFSAIDGIKLSLFDKVFFYNVKGIRVPTKNIKLKNTFNINVFLNKKKILIYLIKYVFFYTRNVFFLKLSFIKDFPTYYLYDNILKKYPGFYVKIFEFSKEDYIFEILANKYKISFIYNLHTLKTINKTHLEYLHNLSSNKNLKLVIVPSKYHYKYFKHFINLKKLYLSKYHGLKRIKNNNNLIFKLNGNFIILLNGSKVDKKLIQISIKKFSGSFFIKPHPFHHHNDRSVPMVGSKDINFEGIIYNNTSAIVRSEFFNIPKYFVKVEESDKDLLEDINLQIIKEKSNTFELIKRQRKYIITNFFHKGSEKKILDILNENINS